jgi:DNA-binding NarL/FixJ family response regulator
MRDQAIRVLIADDQAKVRSALRCFLKQANGSVVVDEASDASDAVRMVAEWQPDLVLLDWELPDRGDVALLNRLRAARPNLTVIAVSGMPEARRAALEAGADAFVSKGDPPDRLLSAVRECFRSCKPRSGREER